MRPDLTASCEDTTRVTQAIVREARRHVVLAEDVQAPAAGFTAEDLALLADELDGISIPTDTAYFGAFADALTL